MTANRPWDRGKQSGAVRHMEKNPHLFCWMSVTRTSGSVNWATESTEKKYWQFFFTHSSLQHDKPRFNDYVTTQTAITQYDKPHFNDSGTTQTAITHDKPRFNDSVTTQTAITHDKPRFNDSVTTQTAITWQTTLQWQYDNSNCNNMTNNASMTVWQFKLQ